jgi:dethiobiotin synthetase
LINIDELPEFDEPRLFLVTGTGTGVGKTIVTAALAALAVAQDQSVAVLKPAQTGVTLSEPGDVDVVRALVGDTELLTTLELARYPDPLAPSVAAARCGRLPVTTEEVVGAALELADDHDLVLIEGAGGLLVRFDGESTLADAALTLEASAIVVTAAGLGTLNHTALTTEALETRLVSCAGLVIGSWPREPDLAARTNLEELSSVAGAPLLGRLPAGAAELSREAFLDAARLGLGEGAMAWGEAPRRANSR